MSTPISVLVIDDSAFMRKMVTEIISRDPDLKVVGQARDGSDGLAKIESLRPDVVTLDVEMPVMDGREALTRIMNGPRPLPVVMLSSLTQVGAEVTMQCLSLGAVDFVAKPSGAISLDIDRIAAELITKIKTAAVARIRRASPLPLPEPPIHSASRVASAANIALLVIGASTGGPRALQTLIPMLPVDIGVPILIVQHMPPGFTESLARRLDGMSQISVREAVAGDRLTDGVALVAAGGHHLQIDASGQVHLTNEPPVHGVRPSVDVTLASIAAVYGSRTVAVILTGMGKDGARGMKTIREMGARTIAEHESTCVVYGMPKSVVELNAAEQILPLPRIAAAITAAVRPARQTRKIQSAISGNFGLSAQSGR